MTIGGPHPASLTHLRYVPFLRRWVAFVTAAFVLNLAWEVAQMPLYDVDFRFVRCLRAAVGDAAIVLAAGAAALVLSRGRASSFWPLLTVGLVVVAAVIEVHALATGRWGYAPAMPTILGLGLSPLVQLALLGVLAARITLRRR